MHQTSAHPHQSGRRCKMTAGIVIACVVSACLTGGAAPGATSSPTPVPSDAGAGASADTRELLTVREPVDTSVTTSARGFTVYATPRCSADFAQCSTWVEVPDLGVDEKPVNTRNGYFFAWPSAWSEGSAHTVVVHSYAKNVFGYWYYSSADTSAGFPTRPYAVRPVTARVASTNDANRSAVVTGTSTPRAEIRRNGVRVATADSDGRWSENVSGLPSGTTTLSYQQWINGTYQDQVSVSVSIAAPIANGGLRDDGGTETALNRGGHTDVLHQLHATGDFSSFSGSVEVDAPAGTTFAEGQETVNGQFRSNDTGSWQEYGGLVLTNGRPNADRTSMTYTWSTRGQSFRTGEDYRFGFAVVTPEDAPAGSGAMAFRVRGATSIGSTTIDGRTTTTIAPSTVENGGFALIGVGWPSTVVSGQDAEVSIGLRTTAKVTAMRGTTMTLHAPEGTSFRGPQTLTGAYRKGATGAWTTTPSLTASGQASADGSTLTATVRDTGASFSLDEGWEVRWTATITAD